MGSDSLVVREYLESLKEDQELDKLFPILLNIMGFRIVATAKEAKGQSQYGKDIIAIGKDEKGIICRFYFELKGFKDRDITQDNYFAEDGVRESILEAKDTAFNDSSIPQFNLLPVKIVFVHNGTIKANIRPTFDGLIAKEFGPDQFERWDIFHLTDLFGKYFFNEYLLTDEESSRLFKKTLVLLDAPGNEFVEFKRLVDLQVEKIGDIRSGRAFNKFFATQNLLCSVITHYSQENGNLEPAKICLSYLLLKTWAWILKQRLETRSAVLNEFRKLVKLHFIMLEEYFRKTLSTAISEHGLFAERGGPFEEIGYPLRAFEYLNYLAYYFQVRLYFPDFNTAPTEAKYKRLSRLQKDIIVELIDNNDGCCRPLLDNHSIAILNVFLFFLKNPFRTDEDREFMEAYLFKILENIKIIKIVRKRFPLLNGNEMILARKVLGDETIKYEDRSSLLITVLFELAAILDAELIYNEFKPMAEKKINMQTAYPNFNDFDIEQLLFEKKLHNEYFIEASISLKEDLRTFRTSVKGKINDQPVYRTDLAGFPYLRTLAHIYFKNEFFPDEWRQFIPEE